jgi:cyanophycinase-like exopeptidase
MDDPGRLSTQYQRAYRAASAIDRAVEELKTTPVGKVGHDGNELGRYLATVAALVEPSLAGEVDAEFVTQVPRAMVAQLGVMNRQQPDLSRRLLETAHALQTGTPLGGDQVQLVEQVADVATRDVLQRSRQILSS